MKYSEALEQLFQIQNFQVEHMTEGKYHIINVLKWLWASLPVLSLQISFARMQLLYSQNCAYVQNH